MQIPPESSRRSRSGRRTRLGWWRRRRLRAGSTGARPATVTRWCCTVDAEALAEPPDVPAGTSASAAAGPGQMPGGYVPAGTPDGDASQSGAEPGRHGGSGRPVRVRVPASRRPHPPYKAHPPRRPRAVRPSSTRRAASTSRGDGPACGVRRLDGHDAPRPPAARLSTSAAARAPCHPCSPPAVDSAASPAAATVAAMLITSSTGPTAAGLRSTTSCCFADRHEEPASH